MTETHAVTPVSAKRRYIRRRNGVYAPLKVSLSANQLLSLQDEARRRGINSPHQLALELLGMIISDKLYAAVLDD